MADEDESTEKGEEDALSSRLALLFPGLGEMSRGSSE